MKCAVSWCENRTTNTNLSFHKFPKDENLSALWRQYCGDRSGKICNQHFLPDDIENNLQIKMGFTKRVMLRKGAVPSLEAAEIRKEREIMEVGTRMPLVEIAENGQSSVQRETMQCEATETSWLKKNIKILEDELENSRNRSKQRLLETNQLKLKIESLTRENFLLRDGEKHFKQEIASVQNRLSHIEQENQFFEKKLLSIFTPGQLRKLKIGKEVKWNEEDISHSITIYSASAKSYRLLRRKGFPLPSVRTIQRWAQKLEIKPGILDPALKIMSAAHLTTIEKVCVLSFDEMKIRKTYCYDKTTDTTYAPVDYVQVAMLRGLMSKWKQPIFFDFDCRMTPHILLNIITSVRACGYFVAAVVSDLGGTNRALFNQLDVKPDTPWILYDDEKIFVFADAPHLIKSLRGHFLDKGVKIDGKDVKKDIIVDLLSQTSTELSITHKINSSHLSVTGPQRQKVKLATKLFSHTIAKAITRAGSLGYLEGHNWVECHKLFKLTNDWFDVMNSRVPYPDARRRTHAYGLAIDVQNEILENMTKMMRDMIVIHKWNMLPFQYGIIQSNRALQLLYEEMKNRFGFSYIMTYRLNQDVLENFFGVIRAKGGLDDHPDRLHFQYRLRAYILGYNEGILSEGANVPVDDTPNLEFENDTLTGTILRKATPVEQFQQFEENCEEEERLECLENDGPENLAGYICHRFRYLFPDIRVHESDGTFSWVDHLSEGGLTKPTRELMAHMKELQDVFDAINGNGLKPMSLYLREHINRSAHVNCDEKIKKLFFRARMFFRMRTLNRDIHDAATTRKRKFKKIIT